MNQPHCVNDITMNTPTVVVKSSPKNNHKYTTSYTIPSPLWKTNHEIQPQISSPPSLAFLSSSPTDVVLSSSSTLFQQQQQRQCLEHSQKSLQRSSPWPIFPMSNKAQRTHNPIRAILDPILQSSNGCCTNHNNNHNNNKIQISLALGDPIAVTQTSSTDSFSSRSATTTTNTNTTTTTTTTTVPLLPCPHAIRAVLSTLLQDDSTAAASYSNAIGTMEGRRAIATYHSHPPYYTYDPDNDIITANGCSGALDILLTSLLDPPCTDGSSNSTIRTTSILLVPSPGFPLYRVIAESNGAMVVSYPLLPNQQWEIDLIQLQNIMEQYQTPWYDESRRSSNDDNGSNRNLNNTTTTTTIRGIVINNPSNPTGAVYSTTHLQQIVHLCQQYHIPIIADEIYGDLIFPSSGGGDDRCPIMDHTTTHPMDTPPTTSPSPTFVSIAQIAAQMGRIVPVVTASGIGKQFLLPGWRIGWICFQDNIYGSLQQVKDGAKRLAQIVLGASHLAQVAIPALLLAPPTEVYDSNDNKDVENASCKDIGMVEYRRSYTELMEWKCSVRHTLYEQSKVLCTALQRIGPCLQVIEPQGAMYAMVRINLEYFDYSIIRNDIDFTKLLYQEENVVVLPGICFDFPNSFRVVFCAPIPILDEAAHRIHQFCQRHLKQ